MVGIPQLREVGWLVTGPDRDPVRYLFLRVEEFVDGSGVWSVELHECRGRRDAAGRARHSYPSEADARAALAVIYRLSEFLEPLPTWDEQQLEPGRWRVRVYEPTGGVLTAHTSAHQI
ncbi:hypothetical protein OHA72_10080 [Dactylosporangium sp. NBC_01737]|uniref:hypothetical protein n=1 Tax=Dactylosporangium sp. NBC_01737 TaxID=2975959 RepID=UPI002E132145|nr:hypothetical protein OHA72_10080 [Dactylosporangium sp. NBC_01737]